MPLGYNSYKNKIKTPSTRTTLPQSFGFWLHWPPLPENQGSSFCQFDILILMLQSLTYRWAMVQLLFSFGCLVLRSFFPTGTLR